MFHQGACYIQNLPLILVNDQCKQIAEKIKNKFNFPLSHNYQDAKWSQDFDPRLQGLITELEKGLGSIIRRSAGEGLSNSGSDFASILTPNDEAQYWADEANAGKTIKNFNVLRNFRIL